MIQYLLRLNIYLSRESRAAQKIIKTEEVLYHETLTLLYTRGLGLVVLHVMGLKPYWFPYSFLK